MDELKPIKTIKTKKQNDPLIIKRRFIRYIDTPEKTQTKIKKPNCVFLGFSKS